MFVRRFEDPFVSSVLKERKKSSECKGNTVFRSEMDYYQAIGG